MEFGESNGSNENPEEKTASLPITGAEPLPAFASSFAKATAWQAEVSDGVAR